MTPPIVDSPTVNSTDIQSEAPYKEEDLPTKLANIMIVDDEEFNILTLQHHLRGAGYQHFTTTTDPSSALPLMWDKRPDLVLLDLMMPVLNGMELLQMMRADDELAQTPVIIVTASEDPKTKLKALEFGASDFLAKPVDASELALRIRNMLLIKEHQDKLRNYSNQLEREVQKRTAELEASQREVIHCLARAGEYRDTHTGQHVIRVSSYVGIIAKQLGFKKDACERMELAAQLHDVGKIGISDSILLKPGALNESEFDDQMKNHCEIGLSIVLSGSYRETQYRNKQLSINEKITEKSLSPLMRIAAIITATHHEKWDGSGYPQGLIGDNIPIEGRITAVADVFDALTSARPYKEAYPLAKAYAILDKGRGSHFDPDVLDAFFARRQEVAKVMLEYPDYD